MFCLIFILYSKYINTESEIKVNFKNFVLRTSDTVLLSILGCKCYLVGDFIKKSVEKGKKKIFGQKVLKSEKN